MRLVNWFQRLKLKHDGPLPSFSFQFQLAALHLGDDACNFFLSFLSQLLHLSGGRGLHSFMSELNISNSRTHS
jgi:hypothetical protein